jgi:hypothetical protein
MKHKIFISVSLLVIALLFTACASKLATQAPEVASDISKGEIAKDQASLVDSLRAKNVEVEIGDAVEQAFFTVKGQIIKINGVDVQIFEYEAAKNMEADAAQISTDGGSIGTSMVSWVATPHFFKSGRILILYVGDDNAVYDLLKGVLGEQFAGR